MTQDIEQTLAFELGEAEETWKATLDFVNYYVRDGRDAIVEGVAVLPSKLAELPFEFRAVFIVNLNDQTETILRHAHENKDDWLSKYDDDTIRAFCHSTKFGINITPKKRLSMASRLLKLKQTSSTKTSMMPLRRYYRVRA